MKRHTFIIDIDAPAEMPGDRVRELLDSVLERNSGSRIVHFGQIYDEETADAALLDIGPAIPAVDADEPQVRKRVAERPAIVDTQCEDPAFPWDEWRSNVYQGFTFLGYWDWVRAVQEVEGAE